MSDEQERARSTSVDRTVFGWALWRALMFAGSLILLGQAVANAMLASNLPKWAVTAATMVGYALLVAGFALAMRARNAPKRRK